MTEVTVYLFYRTNLLLENAYLYLQTAMEWKMHPSEQSKIEIFSHRCEGVMKPFSPQEFAFKHKNVSIPHSDEMEEIKQH